jgi:hypothetical protein
MKNIIGRYIIFYELTILNFNLIIEYPFSSLYYFNKETIFVVIVIIKY